MCTWCGTALVAAVGAGAEVVADDDDEDDVAWRGGTTGADAGCADDEDEGGMTCACTLEAEGRALLVVDDEEDVGMRGKGGRVDGSVSSEREGRGGRIFLDDVRRDCMVAVLLDGVVI